MLQETMLKAGIELNVHTVLKYFSGKCSTTNSRIHKTNDKKDYKQATRPF